MRDRVIEAASDILTEEGLAGLTFAETGRRVGLKVTSVTHYFKRRDDLAAACFDQALDRLAELLEQAEQEAGPSARIRHFIHRHIDVIRAARLGDARAIPTLSGIATLEPALRDRLVARYRAFFVRVRAMFGDISAADKALFNARTHVLLEVLFWLPSTLRNYAPEDFYRVGEHIFRILSDGLAAPDAPWVPTIFAVAMPVEPKGLRDLIKAATTLINDEGYKGASVNKVVALLDVTKGSFYHHLESRDALTLDCFSASYRTITEAQATGKSLPVESWTMLSSIVASLVTYQFSLDGPLLRTTALQGLPLELRHTVIGQSDMVARGFADLVTDCFIYGSGNPVDASVAGQVLMATINAAYVMRNWSRRRSPEQAVQWYAGTVLYGMFRDAH